MRNGREIRSRVTSIAAVAALAISLINMGISQAGAANNAPETDKAYGILNEDGSAKAGISSIADIKNSMSTAGADFVVDTDEDGHAETVLSPTEIRNLLDVSYAADARLEQSLNDLNANKLDATTADSTYAKKTDLSSYALASTLNNYYTKSEVQAYVANNAPVSSNTLTTSYGKVNLDTKATYGGKQLISTFSTQSSFKDSNGWKFLIFSGSSPSAATCLGFYGGYQAKGVSNQYNNGTGWVTSRGTTYYLMTASTKTGSAVAGDTVLAYNYSLYSGIAQTMATEPFETGGDEGTFTLCELQ